MLLRDARLRRFLWAWLVKEALALAPPQRFVCLPPFVLSYHGRKIQTVLSSCLSRAVCFPLCFRVGSGVLFSSDKAAAQRSAELTLQMPALVTRWRWVAEGEGELFLSDGARSFYGILVMTSQEVRSSPEDPFFLARQARVLAPGW